MAFKWGEAGVLYTADTDVLAKGGWASVGMAAIDYEATASPFGYGALKLIATQAEGAYLKAMTACTGRVILQGRIKIEGAGSTVFMRLYNNAGASECLALAVTIGGAIQVYNAASSIIHTTAAAAFSFGVYHYFGLDADIGSGSGIVKFWLDQPGAGATPLINLTGVDLTDGSAAGCDMIEFMASALNLHTRYADLGCMDSSGAALNAYQGEKRWYVLPPTADGSSVGWTASAGSDYQCVDDTITANSDADATYVQGAAGAGAELFTSAALPTGVNGIVYVGVRAEVRKTDGGVEPATTLRLRETTGPAVTDSAALALTQAYIHHQHGSPDVPGGSGWTKAQADAIEFGLVAA